MSQVEESIEVGVPVHTAYNEWTQFETFPEFMSGVHRVEQRTDTEQVGDKLGFVKRQTKGDLERFKKFIEQRGLGTGEWRGVIT